MKSDRSLSAKDQRGSAYLGLLAMAAALPVAGGVANATYTWSAELVAVDEAARTVTVQAPLVSDAEVDFGALDRGDRVTLVWSGINTAAGIRQVTERGPSEDAQLTLPVEFVSPAHGERYVQFKVAVPSEGLAKTAGLQPGAWVTATSPRGAAHYEEAVAELRPYNDVG
jgi:hypothetical protein